MLIIYNDTQEIALFKLVLKLWTLRKLSSLKIINIMTRNINYDFSIQEIFWDFFAASHVECKIYDEINHFYFMNLFWLKEILWLSLWMLVYRRNYILGIFGSTSKLSRVHEKFHPTKTSELWKRKSKFSCSFYVCNNCVMQILNW